MTFKVLFRFLIPGLMIWSLFPFSSPAGENPLVSSTNLQKATFAGGCFWCMEHPFEELTGVISATAGYTGGRTHNPSYGEVTSGQTGHTEAVEILFDPAKISYAELLKVFWRNIDPTTIDRQFCDKGNQYRTGIFYHGDEQRKLAEKSRADLVKTKPFSEPIVTPVTQASAFFPAESYHQDYYKKNPIRYKFYRYNCGRDDRLMELWGKQG